MPLGMADADPTGDHLRTFVYTEAINGDESFAIPALLRLFWRVVHNVVDDTDRALLAFVLNQVVQSDSAKRAVAGVEGRGGQPKRGWQGLLIASEVSAHLARHSVSVEAAWDAVGDAHSLSASAVKGHWRRWKPTVLATTREFLRAKVPEMDEESLGVATKVGVLGRHSLSATERATWEVVMGKWGELLLGRQSSP